MESLLRVARRHFKGVSWQHPVVSRVLLSLDPVDYLVRLPRGLAYLPKYSIRVRSNGVTGQFGGGRFARFGALIASYLQRYAGVTPSSRVLEIGCGCGRVAQGLVPLLEDGHYTGLDVERVALDAARSNRRLVGKAFRLEHLDVQNPEYNPGGRAPAESFRFPLESGSFDVVFLISVFTHMLDGGVRNYIGEIARLLAPGGRCLVSAFLMDHGVLGQGLEFTYRTEVYWSVQKEMPEKAVGYLLALFDEEFARLGMRRTEEPLWGTWRQGTPPDPKTDFAQDILVYRKT